MKQYLDMLNYILEKGETRENRTGVDTIGVFGYQMRFDLQKGFPLLTTKKMAWKSTITELLWFLRGDTNIKYLKDNGCKFWDEWCDENGDARKIYGAQWRRWETLSEEVGLVPIRQAEPSIPKSPPEVIFLLKCADPEGDDLIGKTFINAEGLEYQVLRKDGMHGKNSTYEVQFKKSGYTVSVSRPNLRSNQVRDPFHAAVCGVGYSGSPDIKNDRIYDLWHNMMARCYNQVHPNFARYGAKGVTVSTSWHNYTTFSKEVAEIPFYWHWVEHPGKYELDKDYFGAMQYSKSTAIFLNRSYNAELARGVKPFKFKNQIYVSTRDFCRDFGFDPRRVSEHLSGKRRYSYLQDIEQLSPPEGFVYRRLRVIDQISNVVRQIKSDPGSRRLVVSAWNPADIEKSALPPCHAFFQFFVSNDKKLSCHLYQRSADSLLGVPVNIASYALLTHMIAHVCDLGVGEFIHSFGDLHIYKNHIDQVREQLAREPRALPQIQINPDKKDIFKITRDDITLVGYDPHPAIKGEVAV